MNLRFRSYILITILSLIAVLITGMYLELIAGANDFTHPQVSVMNNHQPQGLDARGGGISANLPEKMLILSTAGRYATDSSTLTTALSDQEGYPYPGEPDLNP